MTHPELLRDADAYQQFTRAHFEHSRHTVENVQVDAPRLVVLKVVDGAFGRFRQVGKLLLGKPSTRANGAKFDPQLKGRHTSQGSHARRATPSDVRQPHAPPVIFVASVHAPIVAPIRAAVGDILGVWPAHPDQTVRVMDHTGTRRLRGAYVPPVALDVALHALVHAGVIEMFRTDGSKVDTIAEGY